MLGGMAVEVQQVVMPDEQAAAIVADVHERSAVRAYAHIFDGPFPRDEATERWAGFTGNVAIARVGGRPVGFIAWHEDELSALYVLPEAAGSGAGTALISHALGVRRLWVLTDNGHARAFYARRGWRPSGRSRVLYGHAEVLEYVLDEPLEAAASGKAVEPGQAGERAEAVESGEAV